MRLSVIVASQDARSTIEPCLESLLAQTTPPEVIVADGSRDGTAELVAQRYPGLCLIRLPYPASLPRLLGLGMKQARGEIVAISEAHCTFPLDWAQSVIAAHERVSEPVIGGVVEPGNGLSLSDWALYFADYGQFMHPLKPGAAAEMPGENVSFKRKVLDNAQQDFAETGFYKTFFCQQLEGRGHKLIAAPEIVIYYNRRLSAARIAQRRWLHGRCFGGMRARQRSAAGRLAFGVVGPALPALLTYRLLRKVWPKGRYRVEFVRSLPIALLAICAWSAGEWWGNLFGIGTSCNYV